MLINAVSAGEVNAIAPFIRQLRTLRPDAQVALLTTTDSGIEMARAKLDGLVELVTFFPLVDLPFASRRFLDKLRPDIYITTEAELWPNMQTICRQRGIRSALVNGRIYMHNKAGWRGMLVRKLLLLLDLIVCQDERQHENFVQIGVPVDRLAVSGNIKFDFELPVWTAEQLSEWRTKLGVSSDHPLVVAGSTHDGEEAIVLHAFEAFPGVKVVIAPRHVDRMQEVKVLCMQHGLRVQALSAQEAAQDWDVLIVDRYGVLVDFYRIADVVVMGGTFHPKVGGHNILEATALGKPVIVGPHTYGITAQVEMLDAVSAIAHAADALVLADQITELLRDTARAQSMGRAARDATEANRGAARRAAELILRLL